MGKIKRYQNERKTCYNIKAPDVDMLWAALKEDLGPDVAAWGLESARNMRKWTKIDKREGWRPVCNIQDGGRSMGEQGRYGGYVAQFPDGSLCATYWHYNDNQTKES